MQQPNLSAAMLAVSPPTAMDILSQPNENTTMDILSQPNENTTAHVLQRVAFSSSLDIILASFPLGKPHMLLQLIGLDVGDDREAQISAALAVSAAHFFAVCTVVICLLLLSSFLIKRRGERHFGATLNARTCTWTVHNRRYNLAAFVEKHPGGAFAINLGRGRNCTELFESYHSLADEARVRACLEEYYLEDAPMGASDYEDVFDWRRTPFFDALKLAVRGHFGRDARPGPSWRTRNHCATVQQWAQLLGFVLATAVALYGFLRADLLALLLLPFCYWWGPSACMHDGGHMALSRRAHVNSALSLLGSFHMSQFSWAHQHTIGHHSHTNIVGKDPVTHTDRRAPEQRQSTRASVAVPDRTPALTRVCRASRRRTSITLSWRASRASARRSSCARFPSASRAVGCDSPARAGSLSASACACHSPRAARPSCGTS